MSKGLAVDTFNSSVGAAGVGSSGNGAGLPQRKTTEVKEDGLVHLPSGKVETIEAYQFRKNIGGSYTCLPFGEKKSKTSAVELNIPIASIAQGNEAHETSAKPEVHILDKMQAAVDKMAESFKKNGRDPNDKSSECLAGCTQEQYIAALTNAACG